MFHAMSGQQSNVESWLDYAKVKFGGTYAESDVTEAKHVFKVAAVFLTFIPYWACNAQVCPLLRANNLESFVHLLYNFIVIFCLYLRLSSLLEHCTMLLYNLTLLRSFQGTIFVSN